MTARQPRAFKLTDEELGAMLAAERCYLSWRTGEFAMGLPSRDLFDRLRKSARDILDVLALRQDPLNPNAARLRLRMQEAAGLVAPQEHYDRMLDEIKAPLVLLEHACALESRQGRDFNQNVYELVAFAADEWQALGKVVTAKGRFGKALREFKRNNKTPQVGGEDQLSDAIKAWKKIRGG